MSNGSSRMLESHPSSKFPTGKVVPANTKNGQSLREISTTLSPIYEACSSAG